MEFLQGGELGSHLSQILIIDLLGLDTYISFSSLIQLSVLFLKKIVYLLENEAQRKSTSGVGRHKG